MSKDKNPTPHLPISLPSRLQQQSQMYTSTLYPFPFPFFVGKQ